MTSTVICYEITLEKCIGVMVELLQVQYNLLTKINDFL